MKQNIYFIIFPLCFYVMICNGVEIRSWMGMLGYTFEDWYDSKNTESTKWVTLNPIQLMQIRNATALEYWRRDLNFEQKNFRRKGNNETAVTKKMKKPKGQNSEQKLKSRRNSQANSNDSTLTSPVMRAKYRGHKDQRSGNMKPKFRQVTSDYRSTRITPDDERIKDPNEDGEGMNQMMSAFNLEAEVRHILSQYKTINVTIETIGRTVEYKDIILVKIAEINGGKFRAATDDIFLDEQPEKKIIFIVHGLSVMGIQYLPCMRRKSHFKKLLSYYLEHLDKFDIYLIPMANPDGYAYVMNSVGLQWNKNISPQFACKGVALDRNFDVAWNTSQSAVSSCSQQYPGETPFSEPETRAVRDIFHRYGHKILAYIHVHSGTYDANTFKGDAVLYPRGYTDASTDDDRYIDLRGEIDETIKNGSFEAVSVYSDTLHSWYGRVTGSSVDYASTVYGVQFALEFVMQLYSALSPASDEMEDRTSDAALENIWGKVINTVFRNIWKSLEHVNEVKKK